MNGRCEVEQGYWFGLRSLPRPRLAVLLQDLLFVLLRVVCGPLRPPPSSTHALSTAGARGICFYASGTHPIVNQSLDHVRPHD